METQTQIRLEKTVNNAHVYIYNIYKRICTMKEHRHNNLLCNHQKHENRDSRRETLGKHKLKPNNKHNEIVIIYLQTRFYTGITLHQ